MLNQTAARLRGLIVLILTILFLHTPAIGQQKTGSSSRSGKPIVSRTPWGDPDLQGVYTFATHTPLERPEQFADKATLSENEKAEFEAKRAALFDTAGVYNSFWTAGEGGKLVDRTSLILDPENGRQPPYTERVQKIKEEAEKQVAAKRVGKEDTFDSWEDLSIYTRCIARALPRIYQEYNHGVQILQSPGYVYIYYESMHDVRIVPLDGRAHVDSNIQLWNGDPRGHWDGNTLVVDSRNFNSKQQFEGAFGWGPSEENIHLTERFRKIDATTIEYTVTVDDPATWTRPWTFMIPWRSDDPAYQKPEDLYEFACHEGNYRMMENSLKGSRTLRQSAK